MKKRMPTKHTNDGKRKYYLYMFGVFLCAAITASACRPKTTTLERRK